MFRISKELYEETMKTLAEIPAKFVQGLLNKWMFDKRHCEPLVQQNNAQIPTKNDGKKEVPATGKETQKDIEESKEKVALKPKVKRSNEQKPAVKK